MEVNLNDFFKASKAYLIAVNEYASPIAKLESPLNDVQALKKVLELGHGFDFDPVPYIDKDGKEEILPNPLLNPDKHQILGMLKGIKAHKPERALVYFACHGIASDSQGDPEGFLLGADADLAKRDTFLSMAEVMKMLNELGCEHLLVILDCCYAGSFRWSERTRALGMEIPKTIYYERFQQYADNTAWQVITSSAHDQEAQDILRLGKRKKNEDDAGLSPFCELLIHALETGEADLGYGSTKPDGIITVTELAFYLREKIFEELAHKNIPANKRQIPSLFTLLKHDKGEFVFLNPSLLKGGAVVLEHQTFKNPYKGLNFYAVDDSRIFYGRKRVLDGWREGGRDHIGLHQAFAQFSPVIVTGPSGIGKSSLVKAGLLSVYKKSEDGEKSEMQPDTIPLFEVENEIRPGKNPFLLHEKKLRSLAGSGKREIILIDQYEELITVCEDELERTRFEDLLLPLVERHTVLITVRSDFENQFKNSPVFMARRKYRFWIPPFSREEIREIVVQPATQEVLTFRSVKGAAEEDESFINKIVDDAYQNPGSLPLLSLALSELYEKRDHQGRNLLESEYKKFNGLSGILDKKATTAYENLNDDPEAQDLFRQLIFRMISFETGRIAKRRIYTYLGREGTENKKTGMPGQAGTSQYFFDELILQDDRRTGKIKAIANDLVNKLRLLRSDEDENKHPYIEPAHDALLRSWPLLAKWLKERVLDISNERRILLLRDVSSVTQTRLQDEEKARRGYLWTRDPRLQEARKQLDGWLNVEEEKFITASALARNRSTLFAVALVVIAFLAVTTGAFIFFIQRNNIRQEASRNKALYLVSESEKYPPGDAIRLLKEAYDLFPDNETVVGRMLALMENTTDINAFTSKDIRMPVGIENICFSPSDSLFLLYRSNDTTALITDANGELVGKLELPHASEISKLVMLDKKDLIIGEVNRSDSSFLYFWNKKGKRKAHHAIDYQFEYMGISASEKYLYGKVEQDVLASTVTVNIENFDKGINPKLHSGFYIFPHPSSDSFYIISSDRIFLTYNDQYTPVCRRPFLPPYNNFSLTKDGSHLIAKTDYGSYQLAEGDSGVHIGTVDLKTGQHRYLGIFYDVLPASNGWLLAYKWDTLCIYHEDGMLVKRILHEGDPTQKNPFASSGDFIFYRRRQLAERQPAAIVIQNIHTNRKKTIVYDGKLQEVSNSNSTTAFTSDNDYLRFWDPASARFSRSLKPNGEVVSVRYIDSSRKIIVFTRIEGYQYGYQLFDFRGKEVASARYQGSILLEKYPYFYDCNYSKIRIMKFTGTEMKTTDSIKIPEQGYDFDFNEKQDKIICLARLLPSGVMGKSFLVDLSTNNVIQWKNPVPSTSMRKHPEKDEVLILNNATAYRIRLDNTGSILDKYEYVIDARFSYTGKYLLFETLNEDRKYEIIVHDELRKQDVHIQYPDRIDHWTISPDEKEIGIVGENDVAVSVYSIDGKKAGVSDKINVSERKLNPGRAIKGLQYSPDNKYILVLHANDMSLYSRAGNFIYTYPNLSRLDNAGFSHDGQKILIHREESIIEEFFTPSGVLGWLKTAPVSPLKQELKDKYELN